MPAGRPTTEPPGCVAAGLHLTPAAARLMLELSSEGGEMTIAIAMVSGPVSDRSAGERAAGEGMRDTPRRRVGEGTMRHGAIASAVAALVLSACGQADPEQTASARQTLIVPPGSSIVIEGAPASDAGAPASVAAPPVA